MTDTMNFDENPFQELLMNEIKLQNAIKIQRIIIKNIPKF